MKKRALIVGGGIAGLALGYWLEKIGIEPIIIERAPHFEALGHYIALKGNGVNVIRNMNLEAACREREVRFEQALFMTASGKPLRKGSRSDFNSNLDGYILFQRADLQAILFEAAREKVEIRYDTTIVKLFDEGQQVNVELSNGETDAFDFVVGADGIRSRTRQLVFGEGFTHPLGGLYVAMTVRTNHGLTNNVGAYLGTGQSAYLFPISADYISAVVYHGDGGLTPTNNDSLAIKSFLLAAYNSFAEEVLRVFNAIDEQSYIFADTIEQVRLPEIVKGRVVLIGDAAHCRTFMSGMGSSLALQGAQILASAIQQSVDDPVKGLLKYQEIITPIANNYQASALEMRPLLLERKEWMANVRDLIIRITPEWLLERKTRQFYQTENSFKMI